MTLKSSLIDIQDTQHPRMIRKLTTMMTMTTKVYLGPTRRVHWHTFYRPISRPRCSGTIQCSWNSPWLCYLRHLGRSWRLVSRRTSIHTGLYATWTL